MVTRGVCLGGGGIGRFGDGRSPFPFSKRSYIPDPSLPIENFPLAEHPRATAAVACASKLSREVGLLLWVVFSFSDYPLQKVTLGLVALNPVDFARIILLLKLDISALMGYTGAVYKNLFGSHWGMIFSAAVLLLWTTWPMLLGMRIFSRKRPVRTT